MLEVVIWQTSVSPHMAGIATELARAGVKITYVAERIVSTERSALGWSGSEIPGVPIIVLDGATTDIELLISRFSPDVVHVVQGLRRNGYLQHVISLLCARRARWGAQLESVRDEGLLGILKRLDYRFAFQRHRFSPDFVLAIGRKTPEWIAARGFPKESIYPFTYFLEPPSFGRNSNRPPVPPDRFVVGYVGTIDSRKRVDILISSLACVENKALHLSVIGSGPLSDKLRAQAIMRLGEERVDWRKAVPHSEVGELISQFDCLVLPSDFDGWGAVVSEALMNGVPAICSDACGAAEAVIASGFGGVFPRGDVHALAMLLTKMVASGRPDLEQRAAIADWALSLGGDAGAKYLIDIIGERYHRQPKPVPPWHVQRGLTFDENQ